MITVSVFKFATLQFGFLFDSDNSHKSYNAILVIAFFILKRFAKTDFRVSWRCTFLTSFETPEHPHMLSN